jgi:hypothetical protein
MMNSSQEPKAIQSFKQLSLQYHQEFAHTCHDLIEKFGSLSNEGIRYDANNRVVPKVFAEAHASWIMVSKERVHMDVTGPGSQWKIKDIFGIAWERCPTNRELWCLNAYYDRKPVLIYSENETANQSPEVIRPPTGEKPQR